MSWWLSLRRSIRWPKLKAVAIAEARRFSLDPAEGWSHSRRAGKPVLTNASLKPRYTMELDSSELLKRFVAADAGIGFIARSNVLEDVRANALPPFPISDATIRRDLALVFRKDKALSRAALAFIDTTVKLKTVEAVATVKR